MQDLNEEWRVLRCQLCSCPKAVTCLFLEHATRITCSWNQRGLIAPTEVETSRVSEVGGGGKDKMHWGSFSVWVQLGPGKAQDVALSDLPTQRGKRSSVSLGASTGVLPGLS